MFKRLLLLSGAALLAYHSSAQTLAPIEVRPPDEAPGFSKRDNALAGRPAATVSQLQEVLIQNWNGSAWVDLQRQTYLRYATPTLPGTIRIDRSNGSAWVLNGAHRYRYTSAGEILSDTTDQYQQTPYGAYFASINTFNTPSQVRWEWYKTRNAFNTTAPWDSLKRNSHSYNAAGQRTQVLEEFYTSGYFSATARRLWTYNGLGQVAVYETQSNSGPTNWDPLQRFSYTYNAAGKLQQSITESVLLGSNTYGNSARNTMSFDAQGRESVLTTETWGTNSAWATSSQTLYTYSANGDPSTATLQAWNPNTNAFQNYQRALYTYAQVTAIQRAHNAALGLAVAPNPGSGASAALYYQLPAAAPVSVDVCDLLGRHVATALASEAQAAGEHRVALTGVALAPGLYLVRLRAGQQQWQTKWDNR
ncbi:T9SS type A sorting domain-containing protein [Hymenobacter sp. DH14]|uniref:T9SS type A sorting domain-containing protein n=1 Tax=Hymenobacter cyanobacteriorum TaxID=2926463 RepID=A0A9X2AFS6_9BACT|nr:T9SS type A sorting domain-containing protein [Hymenobacter cyanobacteriorum]MCI1188152.1 T9SS type A sorting domain-containing protein [Hymenobacter cyanobacteriorum]